jgi:uncharacterized protein (DUF736 family)
MAVSINIHNARLKGTASKSWYASVDLAHGEGSNDYITVFIDSPEAAREIAAAFLEASLEQQALAKAEAEVTTGTAA